MQEPATYSGLFCSWNGTGTFTSVPYVPPLKYAPFGNTVFPNGPYFKGGTYGTDVNVPVPFQEQNNPEYVAGSCKQNQA